MKRIGIEGFAQWAVREEFPKLRAAERAAQSAGYSGWSPFWAALVSQGMVTSGGGYLSGAVEVPHPDAVSFAAALAELKTRERTRPYDIPGLLADMPAVFADAPGERIVSPVLYSPLLVEALPLSAAALVEAHAASRTTPDWYPEGCGKDFVRGDGGAGSPAWFVEARRRVRTVDVETGRAVMVTRTFEEPGLDVRTRRPRPGAYRKVRFEPEPALVARARHAYAVWWCGLEFLAAWIRAECALVAHDVEAPQGIEMPWKLAAKAVA